MKSIRYAATLVTLLMLLSHSAKAKYNQYSNNLSQEVDRTVVDPYVPISFTPEGIGHFFRNVYNRHDYGSEFLPNDFSHMLQFLQNGLTTGQSISYAQSVIKLFSNKLKSATYVNAYVFADMLAPLQDLLKHYFVGPKPIPANQLKITVNDVLYSSFLSQFEFFKKDPKKFFDSLSDEIISSLGHELTGQKKELRKEQLRQTVIRFLELCASKLIWSPEEPSEIWRSVKGTSNQLAKFMPNKIIKNIDHIDDLFWSLTHRFCFFIDLTGADLPIPFYQNIKQDLIRRVPLFCKIQEQEKSITPKADILMNAVMAGEARARATERGIVTYS